VRGASSTRLRRGVGRRVAEIRRERRVTQEQLAERLGVAARYVQSVEYGNENLTLDSLAKLARALGVDVSEFFVRATASDRPLTRRQRDGEP
jgi:transcriptional regulator with XRE-family HTH domain